MRFSKTRCGLWGALTSAGLLAAGVTPGCGGSGAAAPEPDATKAATTVAPVKAEPKAKRGGSRKLEIPDEDTGHSLRRQKQKEQGR